MPPMVKPKPLTLAPRIPGITLPLDRRLPQLEIERLAGEVVEMVERKELVRLVAALEWLLTEEELSGLIELQTEERYVTTRGKALP